MSLFPRDLHKVQDLLGSLRGLSQYASGRDDDLDYKVSVPMSVDTIDLLIRIVQSSLRSWEMSL